MPTIKITSAGVCSVNDVRIDGILESIDVSGGVLMSSTATNDTSGKSVAFTGYDDMSISLTLKLYSQDKYVALAHLNDAYKKLENGVPVIYGLEHYIAKAMNIHTVMIKDIKVRQDKGTQIVWASISLVEREPHVDKIQEQQRVQQSNTNSVQESGDSAYSADALVTEEDKKSLGLAGEALW